MNGLIWLVLIFDRIFELSMFGFFGLDSKFVKVFENGYIILGTGKEFLCILKFILFSFYDIAATSF